MQRDLLEPQMVTLVGYTVIFGHLVSLVKGTISYHKQLQVSNIQYCISIFFTTDSKCDKLNMSASLGINWHSTVLTVTLYCTNSKLLEANSPGRFEFGLRSITY